MKQQAAPTQTTGLQPSNLPTLDLSALHLSVQHLRTHATNTEELRLGFVKLLVGLTNAAGGAFFLIESEGILVPGPRALSKQALHFSQSLMTELQGAAEQAYDNNRLAITRSGLDSSLAILATPISHRDDQLDGALTLVLLMGSQPIETFATVLQLVACLANAATSTYDDTPKTAETAAPLPLKLLHQLVGCGDLITASQVLCNQLAESGACRVAVIGMKRKNSGRIRLLAISGVSAFDSRTDVVQRMEAILSLCVEEDAAQAHEAATPDSLPPNLTPVGRHFGLRQFFVYPLHAPSGEPAGAVLLGYAENTHSPETLVNALDVAALGLWELASKRALSPRTKQGRPWLRRTMLLSVVVMIGTALMWPVDYRLSGDTLVQPLKRRYVSAPFDGVLKESLAKPGDLVAAGDPVAILDERELRWQLASLVADREKALKKRDISAAERDTAGAQLAKLEAEALAAQIDLLGYRSDHLVVKSPISGLVLDGDLHYREGSPLSVGQRLFEVAPLAEVAVEVAVLAEEIAALNLAGAVEIHFDAFPDETFETTISRVYPRAIVRNEASVFIVEGVVPNAQRKLRPGMEGQARIESGERRLGWVLFHRAYHRIHQWLWW